VCLLLPLLPAADCTLLAAIAVALILLPHQPFHLDPGSQALCMLLLLLLL
jgi:hypothetical protein